MNELNKLKLERERLYKTHFTQWRAYPELGEMDSTTRFIDPHRYSNKGIKEPKFRDSNPGL